MFSLSIIKGISGTGSLTIGGLFLNRFWQGNKEIYVCMIFFLFKYFIIKIIMILLI
jgi:hypothetical protein